MFHVHGIRGRVLTGSLDELRRHRAATPVERAPRVAPVPARADPPAAREPDGRGAGHGAAQAYGASARPRARSPVRRVADVMRSPAVTVSAQASVDEVRQLLARRGIGQAPVLDGRGGLVGLVGRAELMADAAPRGRAPAARDARPVADVMWTPVPATEPDTDLRRVAALLLDTGLPGVPVVDEAGGVLGFVSRTDLLRALATDPPLDLWA